MTKKIKVLGVLVAVAILIALIAVSRHHADKPEARIALNIPLSGPIAAFSGEYGNGFLMGVDDACQQIGIPRSQVHVDVQDNAGKPSQAISILERQKSQGFNAYVSGTSDLSNAVSKELDTIDVPHLLIAFDAFLTQKNKNRLRILPSHKQMGPMYVQYAGMRKSTRVFSILFNSSTERSQFDKYVYPGLDAQGVVHAAEYVDFTFTDYRSLAEKAKQFNPDLIFINSFAVHILPLVEGLKAADVAKDGNVLCTMDMLDLIYTDTSPAVLSGICCIAPPFELATSSRARQDWVTKFKSRFGPTPSYVPAYAYDTAQILVRTFHARGSMSKSDILSSLPYEGVTGTVTVDKDGDYDGPLCFLKVAADGTLQEVK